MSKLPLPAELEQDNRSMKQWMDDLGLTEHGSSVPGWLTEKGESFLLLADMLEVSPCG